MLKKSIIGKRHPLEDLWSLWNKANKHDKYNNLKKQLEQKAINIERMVKELNQYEKAIIQSFKYYEDVVNQIENTSNDKEGNISKFMSAYKYCSVNEFGFVSGVARGGTVLGTILGFGKDSLDKKNEQLEYYVNTKIKQIEETIHTYRCVLEAIISIYDVKIASLIDVIYSHSNWNDFNNSEKGLVTNLGDLIKILKSLCDEPILIETQSKKSSYWGIFSLDTAETIFPYSINWEKVNALLLLARAVVDVGVGSSTELDKLESILSGKEV